MTRRPTLFLSRFLLGLWIVLAATFLWLLIPNAPDVPDNAPFAGVSIQTEQNVPLHLPNRGFRCTETEQEFQCQIDIQDQLLTLNLTKGQGYPYDLSNCRASYGRQAVGCRESGQNYAPTLAKMYEITNLNLSPQQIQTVRQTYWGINTLMQLGEVRLTWISAGLAITAGISAAFFTWLHPEFWSKGFVSFACGFGVYQLVERFLSGVPFDVVTPYGLTPEDWIRVIRGGAIAVGIATMLVTALLLWRRVNRFSRVLISLVIGAGIFSLALWSFGWIGYVFPLFDWANQFLPQGHLLALFFIVISVLVAIAAVILIWTYTNLSIRKFLCLGSGFGAIALASNLFMYLLLDLGYID
ncbi:MULTISPECIES: hypothetical protein [Cyanophyceae]|uniref:hypothetical protein n=1 Tax=Cyanophyceae TaxID=3028117 RepID=UPI0016890BE4|nr:MULTISPECIES: hypothetical protein [Cyanophyceae]MBD1915307.1 hypothetical protein [Phormidium sp. FACHB-77]MBD2032822.1 hypothetical protein [Phormidium sp. FACHB-322]MBD2051827.1 hypothetical protein [Leptolyngbya sp. FACHB-60]